MKDWMPCERKFLGCRPYFFFIYIHVSTLYFKYSILPMRASRNSTRKEKGSTFL